MTYRYVKLDPDVDGDVVRSKIEDFFASPFWDNIPDKPTQFPPEPHASTHAKGGSDELALDASQIVSGTLDPARLPVGVLFVNVVNVNTNYSANNGEVVLVDASADSITITLPSPTANAILWIKKIDSSTNVVTIVPSGSETIDGQTQQQLTVQNESVTLVSDGENWYII